MAQILSTTIPAPTEGIVTDVALDVMSPGQALMLENCRFERGVLKRRPAIQSQITNCGLFGTLFTYNKANGTEELLGNAGATTIYRLTTVATAIPGTGTALATEVLSTCHARTLAGGTLLFICDGISRVGVYDGTNFNNAGFTIGGAADAGLQVVTNYKNRLFFSKKNTCELYYTPTATITGALSTYEVGFYFQRGGRILWIGTWSGNAGSGLTDYLLVVSDQGEALIFEGTDPAVAVNWAMVGRFFLPKATSHSNFVQKDADILVLTQDGIYAMSSVISLGQGQALVGLTDPIRNFYKELYNSSGMAYQTLTYVSQLQSLFYPIYCTVSTIAPSPNTTLAGFLVLNLTNNSWSLYTWDLSLVDSTFYYPVNYDGTLYFVNQILTPTRYDLMYFENPTTSDADYFDDIKMVVQTPFNYLDDRQHIKRFISASPYLNSPSTQASCAIMCDNKGLTTTKFDDAITNGTFPTSDEEPNIAWLTAWGKSFSLYFLFSKTTASTSISAINVIYELGGYE